jgi:hypothetical protein
MPRKTKIKSHRSKSYLRKTRRNKNRQRKYYMIGCDSKNCRCSCHRRKGGNYYNLPNSGGYSVDRNMKFRGGSILPDNLVGFGRQIGYGVESVYNGLAGTKAPPNPSPYSNPNI